jgi:methionine salvage enolase-phosphatase E1
MEKDILIDCINEHKDGLAPEDNQFLVDVIREIIAARYYGMCDFPLGHPKRK